GVVRQASPRLHLVDDGADGRFGLLPQLFRAERVEIEPAQVHRLDQPIVHQVQRLGVLLGDVGRRGRSAFLLAGLAHLERGRGFRSGGGSSSFRTRQRTLRGGRRRLGRRRRGLARRRFLHRDRRGNALFVLGRQLGLGLGFW